MFDDENPEKTKNEAKLLTEMNHVNILKGLDYSEIHNDLAYSLLIITEYCEVKIRFFFNYYIILSFILIV